MNINVSRKALPPDALPVRRVTVLRRDIKIIRNCAVLLAVFSILVLSVAGADIFAPTAIAATLALVLAPAARALERLGVPTGIAAVLTVVVTVSCIIAGAFALTPEVSNWLNDAPKIAQSIEGKLQPVTRLFAVVEGISNRISQMANPTPGPAVSSVTVSGTGIIMSAARSAPSVVEKTLYVTVLTIFLLACRRRYTIQLILMPRTFANRLRMARICRNVRSRVSGYLFTLSLINIGLAAVTALCFSIAGIGNAVLWGIAFGVLNFIPIIGPIAIIAVAAVYGFATASTIPQGLVAPLILLALHTVEANLVQPWLLSRRIVISPVAIFLTVVTLVWMWGPAAAITAVPILISLHTVALHMPSLRPVANLLATENGARAVKRNAGLRREPRTLWPKRPRPRSS